jgi:hypothetical protein
VAKLERDLTVNILADTSKMSRGIDDANRKMSAFGSAAKVAGAAIAGGFAVNAVAGFLGDSVKAAQEHNRVMAQTEAVIKSMGNQAKISATEVDALATSIERKTGIDGDAIVEGQNLLLTFGNIRNEVGEGNDIFNQTTKLMVDMAAAMGTDASAGAIQLGKALNDPITGVGALAEVGVSFTEQQKEQIRTMVEAGDVMGAQKIILGELTRQFSGSAEAQATSSDLMRVKFEELQEQIGVALLPIMEAFVDFLSTKVVPGIQEIINLFSGVPTNLGDNLAAILNGLSSAFASALNFLIDRANNVIDLLNDINPFGDPLSRLDKVVANTYSLGPKSWLKYATNAEKAAFAAYVTGSTPGFVGPSRGETRTQFGPDFIGPRLPGAATGGMVMATGAAVIHKGETIVPARAGAGGITINGPVTIQPANMTEEEVVRAFNNWARRNGGARVPGGVIAVS